MSLGWWTEGTSQHRAWRGAVSGWNLPPFQELLLRILLKTLLPPKTPLEDPCTWVLTGKIWQFVCALFPSTWRTLSPDALFTYLQCSDSGHTKTPRICHIFVLCLLLSTSTLHRNAYFSWQTLNCQIVAVLPYSLRRPLQSTLSVHRILAERPPEGTGARWHLSFLRLCCLFGNLENPNFLKQGGKAVFPRRQQHLEFSLCFFPQRLQYLEVLKAILALRS